MIEAKGNMWNADVDAFVITTNGFVKNNGELVMGRGCAREAARRWPRLAWWLGQEVKMNGNHVHIAFDMITHYNGEDGTEWTQDLATFPVKHSWWENADLKLIERSCGELLHWAYELSSYWMKVAMPRPGCGNGQLDWNDVKPILEKYFDDRFIVYDYS